MHLPALRFCILAALLSLTATQAFAIGSVKSPLVEEGELELEYKGSWTHDDEDKGNKNAQGHVLDVGYGFAPKWFFETEAKLERESAESLTLTTIELELKRQLTNTGEFWWDVALMGVYGHAVEDHNSDAVEGVLLLQNTISDFTTRANLGLEHTFNTDSGDTEFWARAWSRYNYTSSFKPGIEWQGNFGSFQGNSSWDEDEHYLGPVAFGNLPYGLNYELGYLFGVSDAAADGAVRWKLEYSVEF